MIIPARTLRSCSKIVRVVACIAIVTFTCMAAYAGPAEKPDLSAIAAMAVALEHGEGVPKDQVQAAALYCEAARLGDARSQFSLAWMYANGRGVVRDDAMAALLFELAAKSGDVDAPRMLRFFGVPSSQLPECLRTVTTAEAVESAPTTQADETERAPEHAKIVELVAKLAPEYEVSPKLALAVIETESGFNANARSPKNAQGIMQLIPETALRFDVKNSFDPTQNIRGGLAYLRWLLAYFKGNVALVAAGYNAGEKAVDKYRGIPPYRETEGYVRSILSLFKESFHPYNARITEPSRIMARQDIDERIRHRIER